MTWLPVDEDRLEELAFEGPTGGWPAAQESARDPLLDEQLALAAALAGELAQDAVDVCFAALRQLCIDAGIDGTDRIVVLDRGEDDSVAEWVFRLVLAGPTGVLKLQAGDLADQLRSGQHPTVAQRQLRQELLGTAMRGRAVLDALRRSTGAVSMLGGGLQTRVSCALVADLDAGTVVAYRYLADAPGTGARAPVAMFLPGTTLADLAAQLVDAEMHDRGGELHGCGELGEQPGWSEVFAEADPCAAPAATGGSRPSLLEQSSAGAPCARVSELLHRWGVLAPPAGCGQT